MDETNRSGFFPWLANRLFENRVKVLAAIFLITCWFALQIPAVKMMSEFADLLPQRHPYIQLHNRIRDTFGGANIIDLMVQVDQGTIFTNETLARIHRLTLAMDNLDGVNHNLVSSVTHRATRRIWLESDGTIKSAPYYEPGRTYTDTELSTIESHVLADAQVYGLLVSPDRKAAVIKGTLLERKIDYAQVFAEVQKMRATESTRGVKIYATGHPVLVGWVSSYSGQILQIFLYTVLIVLAVLVLYMRRLYGIVLPLIGMALTSIWGVGFMGLVGFNLDPLMLVVPFLISARSLSHGIQKVERYYLELELTRNRLRAARNTFDSLFRPGALAIVADASALFLIGLGSVPVNNKMAIYASFWALSMIVTVLVTLPMLLALLPQPRDHRIRRTFIRDLFPKLAHITATPARSRLALYATAAVVVAAVGLSSRVRVGEPEPGSPLLYRNHDYNVSSNAVNTTFPGSEELFVVARTDAKGAIKNSAILKGLDDFQGYMMKDSSLGGSRGVNNLVSHVGMMLRYDDPRWRVIPANGQEIGGIMYTYMMSSPTPATLSQYVDTDDRLANMVFYYKDHTGETIRRALYMVNQWEDTVGSKIDGLHLDLAGGPVGVEAAINEEAFRTNLIVVPAVLAIIFIFTWGFYRSTHAAFMMLMSMLFATVTTYACMGMLGMGLNVNTVPMIAVGIGLGVDYSIYMMDRIKEEMSSGVALQEAVRRSVATTGVAIALTASTLIGGIVMWVFESDLRFQADSARLLIIMLLINAISAMFFVPAWVDVFRPRFVVADREHSPIVRARAEPARG